MNSIFLFAPDVFSYNLFNFNLGNLPAQKKVGLAMEKKEPGNSKSNIFCLK